MNGCPISAAFFAADVGYHKSPVFCLNETYESEGNITAVDRGATHFAHQDCFGLTYLG
jgi:hypothetical protein